MPEPQPPSLAELNERIVAPCNRCPRLRQHCTGIASTKRRAYADWQYWGLPVPSFGDVEAKVMILGLAPGAHGSNRTGRPFTGDGSGDFLYPVLHECGFASQPNSTSRDDGMQLKGLWISAAVRCAPPDNKPRPDEIANCAPYLDQEIALLQNLRVVVCRKGKDRVRRIPLTLVAQWRYRASIGDDLCSRSRVSGAARYLDSVQLSPPRCRIRTRAILTRPMFKAIFERARGLSV